MMEIRTTPSTMPTLLAQRTVAEIDQAAVMMLHEMVRYAGLDRRAAKMAMTLIATGAGKGMPSTMTGFA